MKPAKSAGREGAFPVNRLPQLGLLYQVLAALARVGRSWLKTQPFRGLILRAIWSLKLSLEILDRSRAVGVQPPSDSAWGRWDSLQTWGRGLGGRDVHTREQGCFRQKQLQQFLSWNHLRATESPLEPRCLEIHHEHLYLITFVGSAFSQD